METLSFILLLACLLAVLVAIGKHLIEQHQRKQQKQQQQQQQPPTTLARLDFEDAERELAKAKLVLSIVQTSQNTREVVLQKAVENVEAAADEWVQSLKQVLALRMRNRSASPESKAIYRRFSRGTQSRTQNDSVQE